MPRFDVLISYGRSDIVLARLIERGLSALARPWYRLTSFRVFRDDSSLEAGRERQLMIAWADGSIAFNQQFGLEANGTSALAPFVCERLGDGAPLVLDFRRFGEDTATTSRTAAKSRELEFVALLAQTGARVRNCAPNELVSEDLRRHRQAATAATSAAVIMAILAILATWFGANEQAQRRTAQLRLADGLTLEALRCVVRGLRRRRWRRWSRRNIDLISWRNSEVRTLDTGAKVLQSISLSEDGRYLVAAGDTALLIYSLASNSSVLSHRVELTSPIRRLSAGLGSKFAVVDTGGTVGVLEASTGHYTTDIAGIPGDPTGLAFADNESIVALATRDNHVRVIDVSHQSVVADIGRTAQGVIGLAGTRSLIFGAANEHARFWRWDANKDDSVGLTLPDVLIDVAAPSDGRRWPGR